MDKENYDNLFKFIIIGNSNTGKSCLLHYFIENKYKKSTTHTIGVEFGSKILKIGSKSIKLQIWDTAGQERFKSVARTYYRGALGALVLYDITSPETYSTVAQWIKDAKDLARPDISIMLVGNKSDLKECRAVQFVDSAKFAQEYGLTFIETSALTGENVSEAFNLLTRTILNKIESGLIDTTELQPRILSGLPKSSTNKPKDGGCPGCGK